MIRTNLSLSALALCAATAMTLLSNAAQATAVNEPVVLKSATNGIPSPLERHTLYLNEDVWLNELGTLLYNDGDQDGYFSGLSLSIDADTRFSSFEVYAVIDILHDTSPNNAFSERLHATRPFHVHGRSITDEYRVDIDLVSDYSPGTYDLRVALLDAHSHEILDQVDGYDFRNLRSLSLESEDNQTVHVPVVDQPVEPANDSIRVVEYAGSGGPALLAFFTLVVMLRFSRHGQSMSRT